jgi:cell wall assembly regulator SMI1
MPASTDSALAEIWHDIIEWYRRNAPERVSLVGGPAPEEAITAIESKAVVKLPESYKDSFRIHNGGIGIHKYDYLSAEEVLGSWSELKNQQDAGTFNNLEVVYAEDVRIQPVWWHEGWIPIARDSGGNLLLIDTAPGSNGTIHQLLSLDMIEGPSVSRWKDFFTWIRSFAEDLKRDIYYMKEGNVIRK